MIRILLAFDASLMPPGTPALVFPRSASYRSARFERVLLNVHRREGSS
jgi:hypothetical protein